MTRGVTLVRTVETPEFRQLVAQRFPNSIANFMFQNFPSPNPTSNIRDTASRVAGLATDSATNTPGIANNLQLHARGRAVHQQRAGAAGRDPRHRHGEHSSPRRSMAIRSASASTRN